MNISNKTYEELCKMNIGDMNKEELFDFTLGLLNEVQDMEIRIDKAIELAKEHIKHLEAVKEFYSNEQDFKDMCFPIINGGLSRYDDMLKILERGKE